MEREELIKLIMKRIYTRRIYAEGLADDILRLFSVSGSLTPFGKSIKLLRDLADLQNGAPLEQHRKEWEETMEQVYDFLNRWEGQ